MFEYIIGKVTFVSPYYIVVETNGIGYQISVDNPYRY
ncbi:Holliday junction branch migration protein RuvA, partial [Listeria monocytogenes]|nr:Holliday junction branch migration protein RuvA [Listeria monocytogenes]